MVEDEYFEEDDGDEFLDEEIYSGAYREDLIENGEIDSWEAGFMNGYEEAN